MKRTTIFADDELLAELKALSQDEKRNLSDLVRDALRAYVERKRTRKPLSFVGVGASGKRNVAARHEELLWHKSSK